VIEHPEGQAQTIELAMDRGYASVPIQVIEDLGWSVAAVDDVVALSAPSGVGISFRIGSPFFRWGGRPLQLADAPYVEGGTRYLPIQLLTDFFPRRLPQWYDYDPQSNTLRAAKPGAGSSLASRGESQATIAGSGGSEDPPQAGPAATALSSTVADGLSSAGGTAPGGDRSGSDALAAGAAEGLYEGVRVVVIDAGHGGADPGALGPDGIREKAVALGISTELATILSARPGIEVHMTRDGDHFVDVWDRGQRATDVKGERPGVFISVHANSFPSRRSTRGFETYFLAEARTEHERRVAAIENAPVSVQGQEVDASAQPDLDFILRELRNLDHQHWSALLAEMVQVELDVVHPGPNRGVKQGVLAVLTNALMPSVLVEVGYLSNADEGRLLNEDRFQDQAAAAIAAAVVQFFERYPPGSGVGGSGDGG
jgi:N-acetylmuramoyl-L-alanine amidase